MPEANSQERQSENASLPEEKTYLNSRGVLITASRAILSGKAHRIADMKSASMSIDIKSMGKGIAFAAVGLLIALTGLAMSVLELKLLGIAFVLIGIVNLALAYIKPTLCIRLETANGRIAAYSSKDKELMQTIVDALSQAIADRSLGGDEEALIPEPTDSPPQSQE